MKKVSDCTKDVGSHSARSVGKSRKRSFYIGGNNGVSHIESALVALSMKRTCNPDRFFVKWVECQSAINYSLFVPGTQLVNHIENIYHLTRKDCLMQTLKEYESSMRSRGQVWKFSDVCMDTYLLDTPEHLATFRTVFKPGELWICKPYGRNQGKGIFLLNNLNQLPSSSSASSSKRKTTTSKRLIQKYIVDPLLVRGRKFDIRAYMLIASSDPFIVFYQHGYARLACVPYRTDILDTHVHLTNQYVQKKHHLYAERKEETVLSFRQLNDYINTLKEEKYLVNDWLYNWFVPSIKDIMKHTFKDVRHKLLPKVGVFELLGFDFMIDSEMKPWLIEVNINPALHTNNSVLLDTIPPIVTETLNIVVEVFDKKTKRLDVLPIQSVQSFELLYNALTTFEFDAKTHGAASMS